MKIAIIGVGYWGPNLTRNFAKHPDVESVVCFDLKKERLERVVKDFPGIDVASSYDQILRDKTINGVVIATPLSSHFELAKAALEQKKHVLIEKPMTGSTQEAAELIDLAEKNSCALMVDHTFVYNGAVQKMRDLIDSKEIGDILYYDAVRVNLGLFQGDINVVWDLAPHDISIMDFLLNKKPVAVSAVGWSHYDKYEDIAYVTMFFADNCIAHVHVSWLAPVKVRRILIGGSNKMIVYDDMEAFEKIKIYDKGVEVTTKEEVDKILVQYRMGDMYAPKFGTTEPLAAVANEFVESINARRKPLTDGVAGLNIIRILEAAEKSIKNKGLVVEL
ncbi:MAG: Gfo/Idh/MocA family oxidoreductase [candidate division WOR-3 bacterium]|nr:MAG: Gfo/Idh/MocA family oxidoreductase [candidate division WOR-3 bacterium]